MRGPAIPALPGSVIVVGSAWTTMDFGALSVNVNGTVASAVPAPWASVVSVSHTSFCGLANAGSLDGAVGVAFGSLLCWKCGPAASPVAPHALTWASPAEPRLGRCPVACSLYVVVPPLLVTVTPSLAPTGAAVAS